MAVSIDEAGWINNEPGPKDNPRELEYYEHAILHTIPTYNCVVSWEVSGDFPLGLSIDNDGIISGVIMPMWDQPSCTPKKDGLYMEADGRFYDSNGRYGPDTYDFTFTTTVNWLEPLITGTGPIPCKIPGSTSETHTITLVKDHDADMMKFAKEYLDGWHMGQSDQREPYYCKLPSPSNQTTCELIGGEWDEDRQRCSIQYPQDQITCEAVGGVWEDVKGDGNYVCNISLIKTREECEAIGGVWTKNVLIIDGIEYDNYADWIVAFTAGKSDYDGKVERLQDVLNQ